MTGPDFSEPTNLVLLSGILSSLTAIAVALSSAWLAHSTSQLREIRRDNHARFAETISEVMGEVQFFMHQWSVVRYNATRTGPYGPAGSSPEEWVAPQSDEIAEADEIVASGLASMTTSLDIIRKQTALLDVYGPQEVANSIRAIESIAIRNMQESLEQEILTAEHGQAGFDEMQRAYEAAVTITRRALRVNKTKGLM